MSDDNLILFPKKSKPVISMTDSEAKWMISGSLLVILTIALGVNSTLFSQKGGETGVIATDSQKEERSIASVQPLLKVSWEKKAFEVLDRTKGRDLASVGKKPTVFDHFAFGKLEGKYQIRKVDGKIAEIQFANVEKDAPQTLLHRDDFLTKNLALFSDEAKQVKQIQIVENDDRLIEKYELLNDEGQGLGTVQVLLDKDQKLLSMTVQ